MDVEVSKILVEYFESRGTNGTELTETIMDNLSMETDISHLIRICLMSGLSYGANHAEEFKEEV